MKKDKTFHSPMIRFEYDKKHLSKSTDVRIYRDCVLLTPGEHSDSITRSSVIYSKEELAKSATNWEENYLNLDHSYEVRNRLGFVKNAHWSDGKVKGDLYIFPITQVAKDTIALIDSGLVNWLSVEMYTEDYWNEDDDMKYASNITYVGTAICLFPADSFTRIDPDGLGPTDIR